MLRKKLDKFPAGVLEHISKIIGEYNTGSEIEEFLKVAGYPEKSRILGTKWRHIYNIFKEFNDKLESRYNIVKIIQTFCNPTRWIGREATRKQIIDRLNDGLIYVRLQLDKYGKIVISSRKITYVDKDKDDRKTTEPQEMIVRPIFRARDIKAENDLCFILMPFSPSFDRLYKEKIKPTVEACGFRCLRADDFFTPTPILEDIWIHIFKSRIIVADVTGRNPNVFYEMGIAHTLGKPVIIITQDKSDIPFDIAQFRYFVYSDDSSGWDTLCNNISSAIHTIIGVG